MSLKIKSTTRKTLSWRGILCPIKGFRNPSGSGSSSSSLDSSSSISYSSSEGCSTFQPWKPDVAPSEKLAWSASLTTYSKNSSNFKYIRYSTLLISSITTNFELAKQRVTSESVSPSSYCRVFSISFGTCVILRRMSSSQRAFLPPFAWERFLIHQFINWRRLAWLASSTSWTSRVQISFLLEFCHYYFRTWTLMYSSIIFWVA